MLPRTTSEDASWVEFHTVHAWSHQNGKLTAKPTKSIKLGEAGPLEDEKSKHENYTPCISKAGWQQCNWAVLLPTILHDGAWA